MERISNPLSTAASPTLARLRRDRASSPPELAAALDHVAAHLFSPDFDVAQLRRVSRVAGRRLHHLFREHLGQTPRDYLEECRQSIGSRLLVDTTLPMGQIGELLGYSSAPVFSRAFARFWGERPSVYRRRVRRETAQRLIHQALAALEHRDAETFAAVFAPLDGLLELARESGDKLLHSRLLVARAALAGPVTTARDAGLMAQVRELMDF